MFFTRVFPKHLQNSFIYLNCTLSFLDVNLDFYIANICVPWSATCRQVNSVCNSKIHDLRPKNLKYKTVTSYVLCCRFICALAVIAGRQDLLERIIVTTDYCPEGAYVVRLCKDGTWKTVVIDDNFPVDQWGRLKYSKVLFLYRETFFLFCMLPLDTVHGRKGCLSCLLMVNYPVKYADLCIVTLDMLVTRVYALIFSQIWCVCLRESYTTLPITLFLAI